MKSGDNIHTRNMSVLVNRSPTEEFQIEKGLRQCDPFAPFLLLVALEGLADLMRNATALGLYKPFKVNVSVSLLQIVDDAILVGESSWENLWSIKPVLRGFEFASGLRVNFPNSNIFDLNLPSNKFMLLLYLSSSLEFL